ncbi:endolytic transglycosylase MltG [Kordia sp. YSTF-M3]|uniref:Endolytic transglycosylase MltG n=1 Tax=Kordia aestuariivivens TaxID=2759037 RepID=A0ABR7QCI4_9FLAO|nr:endolytic transglycosylase MltG [Kordia aestuariivivens]MBC8756113.1 endolytic transglycosylase MltG [Kordia aestuariivivens]
MKKILIAILIIGVVIGFYIMYSITQTIFKPITAFNNEEAYIYIPSDADFLFVLKEIDPLVTDTEAFKTLAAKTGYTVKGGKYTIRNGMNSNDIIKVLQGKGEMVTVKLPTFMEHKKFKDIVKLVSDQIEASESDLREKLSDTLYMKKQGYNPMLVPSIYLGHTYTIPWNTSAEEFRTIVFKTYEKRKKQ